MLNRDYSEMLSALSGEGVDFLLVGAYAMAAHGSPRATGDMDLWICRSRENAERTWRALRRFGAPLIDLSAEDLAKPDTVYQIGVAPRRIDILTSIDGVEFSEAWGRRESMEIAEQSVPVIGRDDLIRNKRATGRPQDLVDANVLQQANRDR